MSEKFCARCMKRLPLLAFHRNRSNKDGVATYCKPCTNEYNNTPDQRAKHYARIAKNPEKIREQWKKSHDNDGHRERQRLRIREFNKRQVAELGEHYIKQKITRGTSLKHKDIPQDLVELKRVQIMITREIKGKA